MQKMAQSSLFELGDVIVTEPAEGVYGVAVVLRLHEPEEGFLPMCDIGVTPFAFDHCPHMDEIDFRRPDLFRRFRKLDYCEKDDSYEGTVERITVGTYTRRNKAGFKVIGRIDPKYDLEKPLPKAIGLCGDVSRMLGMEIAFSDRSKVFPEGLWDDARAQAFSASYRSRMDDLMVDWNGGVDERNVKRIAAREGCSLADARRIDIAQYSRARSSRFAQMAQCVFDNVIRLSDPFKFCSYRIIFCCEQSVEECRAPLLCDKILEVWVPFNPFSVFPLPNHERKVAILDMVLSGLEILESVGYPVRFVQEGCRRFAEAGLPDDVIWLQKMSRKRKRAQVKVHYTTDDLVVNFSVFSKDGALLKSENVVTGLPRASWGLPYEYVGSLKWKGESAVVLSARSGFSYEMALDEAEIKVR